VSEVLTPITSGAGADANAAPISTCAGSITSEGDAQLNAAQARVQFNVDGSGIKVGVLSDSFDRAGATATHAANDVASGDLPGPGNPCGRTTPVQLVDDSAVGSDEGRGMAQLVHDLAPGASLAFATAFTSETSFANNIRALATAGSKVIVDDVTYFDEPFFQDGPVAVAVNDVTAAGVTYFSSAANNNIISAGNNVGSFEAPAFRLSASCPVGVPASYVTKCMDFNPTATDDNTYGISVPGGRTLRIDLQWAQPWNGVTTDLDVYLLGTGLATPPKSESFNASTTQKPFEFLSYQNPTASTKNLNLVINRCDAVSCDAGGGNTASPRLKFGFVQNGGQTVVPTEYTASSGGDTVGPTIFGHNGAGNAMSTAAVPFSNSAAPEGFSARGPVTQYFGPVSGTTAAPPLASPETLLKPDIAATDGGQTTFFTPSGSIFRFFGTSAAAPHAAAVAALQLSANPSQSVDQVKAAQKATAVPVGGFGPEAVGSGLINALGAVPANPPPWNPTVAVQPLTTNDNTPALSFTVSPEPKATTCSIDGAAAVTCASPFVPAKLGDGSHTLTVNAVDYFGQSAGGSSTVNVDTTKPTIKLKKKPAKRTSKTTAKFKIKSEQGATLSCKLDKKKAKQCTGKAKFRVGPGKHKLVITATDAVGNVGKLTYKWKVT
jgi:hypothetical protein